MYIYHVMLPETWESVKGRSMYEAASLTTEGFVHCSYAEQLEGVLERYYSGAAEVTIITIETLKLTSKLLAEPSTGGEIFPHIYGPIDLSAVANVERRAL